jgi:copper chaperone
VYLPQNLKYFSAIFLVGLVINSLFKKDTCPIEADLEISLADIHCQHCKIVLEKTIKEIPEVSQVVVDVDSKKIFITGTVDKNRVCRIIKQAGYTPLN